jgi:CheY-like chemotaxis protein
MLKVLVVDDNEHVLMIASRLLARAGHEVATATSVSDARIAFRTFEPDLVITDMQMPGGNGDELIRWVRTQNDSTRVVLMGGLMRDARNRDAALSGSPDAVLAKPFMPADLISIAEEFAIAS